MSYYYISKFIKLKIDQGIRNQALHYFEKPHHTKMDYIITIFSFKSERKLKGLTSLLDVWASRKLHISNQCWNRGSSALAAIGFPSFPSPSEQKSKRETLNSTLEINPIKSLYPPPSWWIILNPSSLCKILFQLVSFSTAVLWEVRPLAATFYHLSPSSLPLPHKTKTP